MDKPKSGAQIMIESLINALIRAMKLDPVLVGARIAETVKMVENAEQRFCEIDRKVNLILQHMGVEHGQPAEQRDETAGTNDGNRQVGGGGTSDAGEHGPRRIAGPSPNGKLQ